MPFNLIIFAIISLPFTWLISQAYKMVIGNKVFGKKVSFSNFFADGNFPSTHSATSVAMNCCIIFILIYVEDKVSALTLSMIILVIFDMFKTLRDACGHRHRQDKTNRILAKVAKNQERIVNTLNYEAIKKEANHIAREAEKEANKRVGHRTYEVIGGALLGFISSLYLIAIFFFPLLLALIIPISLFYFWFFIKLIKRKRDKKGSDTK